MSPRRIQIFDTTLPEGAEALGAALRPRAQAELAAQLERLGVDVVEAADAVGARAVAAAVRRPVVALAAGPGEEELAAAADALAGSRRSRIHVVGAASAEQARRAVAYAAGRVDEVQLSCEGFDADVCRAAVEAGATVVSLVDGAGTAVPAETAALVREARRALPGVTLSVRCRDDLGLAVANALAGARAGADQVECAVNGLGARAGTAALEEVVVALRVRTDWFDAETGVSTAQLSAASRLVSSLTGRPVQPNKAVVGANAFAHEAGIHQDGMLKDERTYQIIDPAEVGVRMTLPLGKHSGRHAFASACAERGWTLVGEELNAAFRRFKELADGGRSVTLEELFEGVTA
ncbi:MAG: hypothetical protein JOZ56_09735 [Actinobacteria bacterium]|nr:hypothetical protein [Actinomycetota bacterium]